MTSDGSNYNWGPFGKQYLALCVRVLAQVADRACEKGNVSFSYAGTSLQECPVVI